MDECGPCIDTLFIGCGVVATAISQRLLERSPLASIIVLEAGRRIRTKDFALWEQYLITARLPYEVCRDLDYPPRDAPGENASLGTPPIPLLGARLFVCGGSTMHWGGGSFRLKPKDFRLSPTPKKVATGPSITKLLNVIIRRPKRVLPFPGIRRIAPCPERATIRFPKRAEQEQGEELRADEIGTRTLEDFLWMEKRAQQRAQLFSSYPCRNPTTFSTAK